MYQPFCVGTSFTKILFWLMKRLFFYLIILVCNIFHSLLATNKPLLDSLLLCFNKQLQIYPQEKLYVQTDKSYYVGGEDIWFRAYLCDYTSHIPDTTSRYVYTELIDPLGKVLMRIKTLPRSGAYYGNIRLQEELPEGTYRLRSYTSFMKGLGEDYMYWRNIYVRNPSSADIRLLAEFTFNGQNTEIVNARIQLEEIKSSRKIEAKEMRYQDRKEKMKVLKMSEDSIYRFACQPEKELSNRLLYIEYDYSGRFHKQYMPVPYPEKEYDVSFWPEGGSFPAETDDARIGFKSLSADGLGEIVEGNVVDSSGNIRAIFNSNALGMGVFQLNAQAGERLYAECKNRSGMKKRFELPVARQNVYSLGVKRVGEIVNFYVATASDQPVPEGLYLLLQLRGALLYCKAWDGSQKFLQIRGSDLPSGVLQALLVDSNRNPLSVRLFFNLNKIEGIDTELETDRSVYGTRERISSIIRLRGGTEIIPEGDLSISVTSDKDVRVDTASTIISTMLLTSELKGNIENPGFYFSGCDLQRSDDLDYLMLTQGWGRYNIRRILKDSLEYPKGQLEIGPEISGTVGGGGGIRGKKGGYLVSATTFVPAAYEITETDEMGHFHLTSMEMPENTRFLIQALTEDGKGTRTLDLRLDSVSYPPVSRHQLWRYDYNRELENYVSNTNEQYKKIYGDRMIFLDEVVVKAKKRGKSFLSVGDSRVIPLEKIEKINAGSLAVLLTALPSVGKYPLIIDGMPIEAFRSTESDKVDEVTIGFTPPKKEIKDKPYWANDEFIVNMPKEYIEELEVVEPWSQGAFYVQSKMISSDNDYVKSGALLITTKARNGGFPTRDDLNKKTIVPLGYQIITEFYSPRYETIEDSRKGPFDLRTTIYWNPSIKTSKGEVSFDFYSADIPGNYTITVEGISPSGKLMRASKTIQIMKKDSDYMDITE